jgi:hypothetical protein
MKRLFIALLVILAAFFAFAISIARPQTNRPVTANLPAPTTTATPQPSASATFEVRLASSDGSNGTLPPYDRQVKFNGGCMVNGTYASIEGRTPKTYTYSGDSISCTYQKQEGNPWPLRVTAKRNGATVQLVSTESEYGVVSFVA